MLIIISIKCKKNHKIKLDEDLEKLFANISKFCLGDIDKFVLILQKRCSTIRINELAKIVNETYLLTEKNCYSNLNMEYMTDKDSEHTKSFEKELNIKNLDEH